MTDNTAPEREDRVCGDDNCYPPADRVPCEDCPDFAPEKRAEWPRKNRPAPAGREENA